MQASSLQDSMSCPFFQLDEDVQMEIFDMLDFADRCARRLKCIAACPGTVVLPVIPPCAEFVQWDLPESVGELTAPSLL